MKRTISLLVLCLTTSVFAQQQQPPNQVALAEAREHAKNGRVAEAIAALERVTPPAPGVLNVLRTSDDFKALREDARVKAIIAKLMPCAAPQYRQFDFWLGEWEVRSASGQLLGHNRITSRHGGCVVMEEWDGAAGGSGSSFNFYDQPTKQWHQFWVDASGTNWLSSDKKGNPTTMRGGIKDGAMVMTGDVESIPSVGLNRVTFRPLEDGRVRQTFEASTDGGKTWTPSFDGFYKKVTKP